MKQQLNQLARHYQYREKAFALASGVTSHAYLDCRAAFSQPKVLRGYWDAGSNRVLKDLRTTSIHHTDNLYDLHTRRLTGLNSL